MATGGPPRVVAVDEVSMIVLIAVATIGAPASASELDEIKGWRATRSVRIAADPEYIDPHTGDLEAWGGWAVQTPLACAGPPADIGRECSYTDADGRQVRWVITAVEGSAIHFDTFIGGGEAAKAILSWSEDAGGTTLTWDVAGTTKAAPKEWKKTAADMVGKEIDLALFRLKLEAERAHAHAEEVEEAERRAADLEKYARVAEAAVTPATVAYEAARAASEAATLAVTTAKPKDQPALQAAADEAARVAEAAKMELDVVVAKASTARKQADDARAAAKKIAARSP